MSEAREKLIKFCLEKYPHITQENAESVADELLAEAREKSENDIKSRIKRKAGLS